ncbi:MAG: hypothetical protein LUG93_13545 [Lachnospiraceae bacterium]|nr:hypothetical protein [Lachnospiraceae bacterium]MCD7956740.1 hypothetical protein [Lachnospiraceae bacterium]
MPGVKVEYQWSTAEYRAFLEANGWKVMILEEMSARITLAYAECVKQKKKVDEGGRIWKKSH